MKKNIQYTCEEIYVLLHNKDWDTLLSYEKTSRNKIIEDTQLKNIFDNYFISEYIKHIESLSNKLDAKVHAVDFYKHFIQLYYRETYNIKKDFENFVTILLRILDEDESKDQAYSIAKKWNQLKISEKIIKDFEKNQVNHSQKDIMKITKITNNSTKKHMIKLFKSGQEMEFFYAIRDLFPNYFTYPNVALSCIINYDSIKETLNNEERNYFFKAIIDCVVFEIEDKNFKPIYFYELDSFYHDNKKQITNDKIKDNIFERSGLDLFRIRPKENTILNKSNFTKAIIDCNKEHKVNLQ